MFQDRFIIFIPTHRNVFYGNSNLLKGCRLQMILITAKKKTSI